MNSRLNSRLIKQLRKTISREAVKESLKAYMEGKGLSDFDGLVIPTLLTDIRGAIPELYGKIEVDPYVDEFDPVTGVAKVGWNLYVMGHERMYLGRTIHNKVTDLMSATIPEHAERAEPEHTVRDVMSFIMTVLNRSKNGFERLPQGTTIQNPQLHGMRSINGPDGLSRSFMQVP